MLEYFLTSVMELKKKFFDDELSIFHKHAIPEIVMNRHKANAVNFLPSRYGDCWLDLFTRMMGWEGPSFSMIIQLPLLLLVQP